MNEFTKYVGLDVHKETIAVAIAQADGGEVRYWGEIANTAEGFVHIVCDTRKDLQTLLMSRILVP